MLEQQSKENQKWFNGQNAHKMYISQAQGTKGKNINFEQRKQEKPFRPGKGKYGNVVYNRVCWHCGKNGHTYHDCIHKKKQMEENARKRNQKINNKKRTHTITDLNDPYYFIPASNPQTRYQPNSPRKATLSWVPKA